MGAIIKRELIDVFRTPKSFLMQIALAVVFSLLVILQWPTEGKVDLSSQQSRQVFQIFGYGLLTVIVLMSPALMASNT